MFHRCPNGKRSIVWVIEPPTWQRRFSAGSSTFTSFLSRWPIRVVSSIAIYWLQSFAITFPSPTSIIASRLLSLNRSVKLISEYHLRNTPRFPICLNRHMPSFVSVLRFLIMNPARKKVLHCPLISDRCRLVKVSANLPFYASINGKLQIGADAKLPSHAIEWKFMRHLSARFHLTIQTASLAEWKVVKQ